MRAPAAQETPRGGRPNPRAAIAVWAVLLGGCGLGPQDSFTGQRLGDGIAPWGDVGPLVLCRDDQRIVAPGSSPGGACVASDGAAGAACAGDDACRSRERCVCGTCTVQVCTASDECRADQVCKDRRCDRPCSAATDCAAGEVCLGDVCRNRCQTRADCQTGEICTSQGRCVLDECASDADCPATDTCRLQRQPRDAREPTLLTRQAGDPQAMAELTMWLELRDDDGTRAVWRAVSSDGLAYRLEPSAPVLESAGGAGAPAAVRIPGGVRLYFEAAGGVFAADSADGIRFGDPTLVLAGDLHAPTAAMTSAGEALLYAEQGDGEAIVLTRAGGAPEPVLTPGDVVDPVLWRAVGRIGSPYVLLGEPGPGDVPTVRLWFAAFGQETADAMQLGTTVQIPANDSIGYAAAPLETPGALAAWPYNPVHDRVLGFLDHRAETAPAVVQLPGTETWLLYYLGASADGITSDGLRVARNPP